MSDHGEYNLFQGKRSYGDRVPTSPNSQRNSGLNAYSSRFPPRSRLGGPRHLPLIPERTGAQSHMHPSKDDVISDEAASPLSWQTCFDDIRDVEVEGGSFRCYLGGSKWNGTGEGDEDVAVIFLHGGGHCALSWGMVARVVKKSCLAVAYDARGHGKSRASDERDLSAEQQVRDATGVIRAIFGENPTQKIVVCGHSMGGAIAARLAAGRLIPTLVGLIVIDVVEGTAMSSLPYMLSWLDKRPKSFTSVEKAVRYVVRNGQVRNLESARISVPSELLWKEEIGRFVWRAQLEQSEKYWRGWFEGLSSVFLEAPAAKLLILAGIDRLDRELTIAQMQGRFQNLLISSAGHAVHEDRPNETAEAIVNYLKRNLFLNGHIIGRRTALPFSCGSIAGLRGSKAN